MAVLLPFALLLNGVLSGMLLWSVVGGTPWVRRLNGADYLELHQFWLRRLEPLENFCVSGALLADATLIFLSHAVHVQAALGVAVGALSAVMVISATRSARLRQSILVVGPHGVPDDWRHADPRERWERWNIARAILTLTAFTANVTAVGALAW
ncbi:hypothetical protein SAMN05421505_11593 [Sinosporangium album]|uniref:DUF1772 domain-containing protein n=1 Tax=Sinosporangium album TaxID=504805 RepID=A0A1G8C8E1_9ACTN|nr:hypothetical protein [Sinosporangium album]SDH41674.1 hypothetical protein SAMN05421505_11593 [Sinosporangium album]